MPRLGAGQYGRPPVRAHLPGEVSMFEYDEEIVNTLLEDNNAFQALYRQHHELKEKVRDAELGVLPLDDLTVAAMKKRKLLTKDKMAAIIEDYRRSHA
jgi:uncharacterized protein YdcH (DUF465 family)